MLRISLALGLTASAILLGTTGAYAQVEAQSFGSAVVGPPALGVSADGQAVLAWSGSVTTFASVRPAGGAFGPRQRLSTGGNASRVFALGVGRRGDAVVVWQRTDRGGSPTGPLYANVRGSRGAFSGTMRVPGSEGGRTPSTAVSPDGTIVVAWRRTAARGCGSIVVASVARPGHSFGTSHRVSGACPSAQEVRATMSADGTGAIVWRAGRARDAYVLEAAAVGHTQFGIVRRVSRTPVVGFGAEVAGADTGGLLVWRDRISGDPRGSAGRVLSARVAADGVGAIVPVSAGDGVVGVPRVTARPDGSALVVWEEGVINTHVFAASRSATATAFAQPTIVDRCGAVDASRTYASPALDARGSATTVFQSACMGRFGLGTDYGIALARRQPGADWQAPQALSHGTYSAGARVATADSGELVLAWAESGSAEGLRVAVMPG